MSVLVDTMDTDNTKEIMQSVYCAIDILSCIELEDDNLSIVQRRTGITGEYRIAFEGCFTETDRTFSFVYTTSLRNISLALDIVFKSVVALSEL